jgi:hypothetical protein
MLAVAVNADRGIFHIELRYGPAVNAPFASTARVNGFETLL